MKNYIIIIFLLFILFTKSSFSEILGTINERVDEQLISEFFENYTNVKNNENDDRIIEVFKNNKLEGYIFSTWDMVKSLGYDRSPYEIIIGLNYSGTIAGAKLTYHNEPLFEHE